LATAKCRVDVHKAANRHFTRQTPRTPPRATEFHFSFILLLDTTPAEVVGLVVGTLELDQTAILGVTPTTMQMRFIIHQFGHDPFIPFFALLA
jgi:hypothetical protein